MLKFRVVPPVFVVLAFSLFASGRAVKAQISKGHQILINRGLQLQGLGQDDCYLHLDTYSDANYTSINWNNSPGAHSSRPEWMGPPPGFPWARWVWDTTQMPPQLTPNDGDETPYISQLLALQLGDEWNLNDGPTRTNLINWFNSVRTNWPNVILYHNNWGSQVGDGELADFYTKAHPDMLCFDTYPWQSVWDINQPNHTGPPIPGPPTGWYGDLRRYREHAKGAGIPLGIYRQTFHAVQDYDYHVFRDPSPSELRLNTFAALAFNVKFITDFIYNTGAASLFTKIFNGSGDTQISTNGLYAETADINRRGQILGKALVCLTPIYDLHNQTDPNPPPGPASGDPCACLAPSTTTSIMYLQGRLISGGVTNATPLPVGFQADPQSSANPANAQALIYSWWESAKNDPYFNGWGVTNKAGINNSGLPGEVIVAWFKPLDESFDGTNFSGQIYMMVVNGLTATNGTAADCTQEIKLNFLTGTSISAVDMLNLDTGRITTITMPVISGTGSNTKRQLVLDLNGGDAALFKFSTGAPFVGYVNPSAARLSAAKAGNQTTLTVQGTVGARYQIQSAASLPPINWTTSTNLLLPSSPFTFTDTTSGSASRMFYRAVGIMP